MPNKQDWKNYWKAQERKKFIEEHAVLNLNMSGCLSCGAYCGELHERKLEDYEDPYTGRSREWEDWN